MIRSNSTLIGGDPEGQMRITPGGYQWITDILIRQAVELNAPVCLLLEGGYFLETLAVNVEFCIKALLGKPLPRIDQSFCDKVFLNSLHTAVAHYGRMFPSLSLFADVVNRIRQLKGLQPVKPIDAEYKGFREFVLPYPTRGTYKNLSKNTIRSVCGEVESIMKSYNEPHQTVSIF
ncbi:unnamed protein product [Anisakis simplex]|uniref:Hist_deacetyl domain-containing protein n=1 Tax=Anisakis simplex TaxID=6269 RepID=A0A0M3J5G7_ANISI|nr:unnamed protein product [Anisakis simplex]